ncbi:ABC transporter substrate-binding protein [Ruminococcaceae bacterium OttesenSCG-928-D13]|nr:ABC transporter substrate-binding protein [Ruminococcaceae bacterium OttesenSCG-928-D13]
MKKFLCVLLAAMLVMALAAGGGGDDGQTATASFVEGDSAAASTPEAGGEDNTPSGDEILIGGLAPQTGEVSQYGMMAMHGAELAVKEINAAGGVMGKQVMFNCLDEQGDATEAVAAYNKLMQDGMVALWGDVTTKPSLAVAQRAVEDDIVMITPTGTGADITIDRPNVFRACFTDPYQGELMAKYAKEELGAATASVLYDSTDDYSEGVYESFKATAESIGLEVLDEESYEQGASDFNAQLTKIKNKNPDVIMVPCYYEDASKIIAQARGLGIESKLLGPDGWASLLGHMDESNLAALDGAYYSNQYDMANPGTEMQKFMADFEAEYGEAPDMFAALGYEAMYLLCTSIDNAGSTDTGEIVQAFHRVDYTGLYGRISYENGNDPTRGACIVEFKDGTEVSLGMYTA